MLRVETDVASAISKGNKGISAFEVVIYLFFLNSTLPGGRVLPIHLPVFAL